MVQNCNDHKPVDHNEQNPVTKRSDPLMNQERDYIWWTNDQSDTRETINQEFVKMGMNGKDRRRTQIKLNNPFELPHKTC